MSGSCFTLHPPTPTCRGRHSFLGRQVRLGEVGERSLAASGGGGEAEVGDVLWEEVRLLLLLLLLLTWLSPGVGGSRALRVLTTRGEFTSARCREVSESRVFSSLGGHVMGEEELLSYLGLSDILECRILSSVMLESSQNWDSIG